MHMLRLRLLVDYRTEPIVEKRFRILAHISNQLRKHVKKQLPRLEKDKVYQEEKNQVHRSRKRQLVFLPGVTFSEKETLPGFLRLLFP